MRAFATYHIGSIPRHHAIDEPHHFPRRALSVLLGEHVVCRVHLPYRPLEAGQVGKRVRETGRF